MIDLELELKSINRKIERLESQVEKSRREIDSVKSSTHNTFCFVWIYLILIFVSFLIFS